jgi:hypothetical protein
MWLSDMQSKHAMYSRVLLLISEMFLEIGVAFCSGGSYDLRKVACQIGRHEQHLIMVHLQEASS